jgi:hypothetical protein
MFKSLLRKIKKRSSVLKGDASPAIGNGILRGIAL